MSSVHISGPLFDGRAVHAVHDLLEEVRREVAQQGLADLHHLLDASIRHPTPYYETQVNVRREPDAQVINDRGIVYGPWLEGVGSRNRTTRFKGYYSFRRTVQLLRRKAPALAEHVLHRYLRRMG